LDPDDLPIVETVSQKAEKPMLFGAGKPDTTDIKDGFTALFGLRKFDVIFGYEGLQLAMPIQIMNRAIQIMNRIGFKCGTTPINLSSNCGLHF
jgi:hypothetical protein